MGFPTIVSLKRLRRIIWRYDLQERQQDFVVMTDAGWADCRRARKSTSGGGILCGSHCIKVCLTAEFEPYGVVEGACEALGVETV